MIAGVAFQIGLDLAQAPRAAKLRMQQTNQMSPGLHHAVIPVGIVLSRAGRRPTTEHAAEGYEKRYSGAVRR
jgi:hypothetical protein